MNQKKYKYILFDWDGCLAKTLGVWMNAYKIIYAQYNVYPTEIEIARHFGDWESPKYFGITDVKSCINKLDELASSELKKVALYVGAKELLKKLHMDKQLALLTSSPGYIIKEALKYNKLNEFFKIVLTAEDVKNHKPHPEMINKGINLLDGNKNEAIMIGDSRKDLEAANNSMVDSILVYPKEHSIFYNLDELKRYKPTYIVSSLPEIMKIIS